MGLSSRSLSRLAIANQDQRIKSGVDLGSKIKDPLLPSLVLKKGTLSSFKVV
jgi:hypothetical protein